MIVAINKPVGPTSHDIVDAVRRITGERRVGHAGTLDPRASGVLVVGIGRTATKKLGAILQGEKAYTAHIHLGAHSETDDAEGEIHIHEDAQPPSEAAVTSAVSKFVGTVKQTPPRYSAIKVRGRPAHRRMRAGEDVSLSPRSVSIKNITIIQYDWPQLIMQVTTGSGVYIRALARDIGAMLGVGGYLSALERTRVGAYTIEQAYSMEAFERMWNNR